MSSADFVAILAAGEGKRMGSPLPKVLHEVCGRPLLGYVIEQALTLSPRRLAVVVGHGAEKVTDYLATLGLGERLAVVVQETQGGTGHALQCCASEIEACSGSLAVVLSGDMPLLRAESLANLCADPAGEGMALLTAERDDARGFGRVIRAEDGTVRGIVEERDATEEQRALREVNLGVYAFSIPELLEYLPRLSNENAQGEYYLTDVVGHYVAAAHPVRPVPVHDLEEGLGVNDPEQWCEVRRGMQLRIIERLLAAGVRIEDPNTTFIDADVTIGRGTRILPCTVIRGGVAIGEDCEVGPFTHLRPGTVLADGAEVGNFTEAKNASLGPGTKAKHLTYLGDVSIGAGSNIGAGTVFANYDGREKHHTTVGEDAFVGSGTIIVAPASIGRGSTTGAGAVVTRGSEVPGGETWVGVPARPIRRRSAANQEET